MARTTIDDMLALARTTLVRLEPEQALAAQRAGALIVDSRSHDDRARLGTIPGSVHIPRTVLEWRLDPESPHRNMHACDLTLWLIIVCTDGYSSSLAAATLQQLGYARATDLIGGFTAWERAGLPVVPAPVVGEGPAGMGVPAAL